MPIYENIIEVGSPSRMKHRNVLVQFWIKHVQIENAVHDFAQYNEESGDALDVAFEQEVLPRLDVDSVMMSSVEQCRYLAQARMMQ